MPKEWGRGRENDYLQAFRIQNEKLNDRLKQTFVGNMYKAHDDEFLHNSSRTGRL